MKTSLKILFSSLLVLTLFMAPASPVLADLAGGCDFSPANNGTPNCLPPLAGTTFAGGDGNLLASPTTFGSTDWENVAGLNVGYDLPSGKLDNSFGQGTKEDVPTVSVVTGSIPPNKSDLTRFYVGSEFASGDNFLYLAWERTNVLGTANFDFEINQMAQPDLTTPGTKTLVRTAGDLLVTYDFTNGGGRPAIGLLRWLTSATVPAVPNFATNVCFSSNTFPCWGDAVTLDGTDSIAAVNNLDSVNDPLYPTGANYINPVPALQFGEVSIDLTKAGVFPSGTCLAFGSAFVRSRSSASFTAEVKDFIAPIPVNISNCGSVNIIKHTDPRGVDQSFSFTTNIPSTATCSLGTNPASFSLNDSAGVDPTAPITSGTANTEHCANVPVGSYTVSENTPLPANFVFESLVCSGTAVVSGSQATVTVNPGDTVTCVYVNKLQQGAIKVTKTSVKGNTPLAGAKFSVSGPSGSTTLTTGSDGTACVDSLTFGDYTVAETSAPTGYKIDDSTSHTVSVNTNAKCGDATYVGGAISFSDTPLSQIEVKFSSLAGPGVTNASIVCQANNTNVSPVSENGNADPAFDDTDETFTNLQPGTYTCTVVVDP